MNRNTLLERIAAARKADERADLKGIDLSKAYLRQIDLESADLCQANLSQANLCQANLHDADLEGANLRGADLRDANLSQANLYQADLRDTDLRRAILDQADLREAKLDGAKFEQMALNQAYLNDEDLPPDYYDEEELPLEVPLLDPLNGAYEAEIEVNQFEERELYFEEDQEHQSNLVEVNESPFERVEERLNRPAPHLGPSSGNSKKAKVTFLMLAFLAGVAAIRSQSPSVFWLLLTVALLFIGMVVIDFFYSRYNEGKLTRGKMQLYRLHPLEGEPKPFLLGCGLPSLMILGGMIFTLFMAIRLNTDDDLTILTMISLFFVSVLTAITLFEVIKNLYLLYTGSETIVELSNYPLKSGESTLLYISHQPGSMALQRLIVRVICKETTRTEVERRSDNGSRYRYDAQTVYDMILHTEEEQAWSTVKFWEQTLVLSLPHSAKPTTATGHYPQIKWSIHVKLAIPNAPDITISYPVEVIE